jgi:hypothetical protein
MATRLNVGDGDGLAPVADGAADEPVAGDVPAAGVEALAVGGVGD